MDDTSWKLHQEKLREQDLPEEVIEKAMVDDPNCYSGSDESICNLRNVTIGSGSGPGPRPTLVRHTLPAFEVNKILQDLKRNDSPPEQIKEFCPWYMIYKYPKNFVGNKSRNLIENEFTKKALLTSRVWHFFYIHYPACGDAVLLVPTWQFEAYLEELNKKHDLSLGIPEGKQSKLFAFTFPKDHTPCPRFVGRCNKPDDYGRFRGSIPTQKQDKYWKTDTTDEIFKRLRIANNLDCSHNGKMRPAFSKAPERRKNWGRTTKRVQRYLGLRRRGPLDFQEARSKEEHDSMMEQMKLESRVEVDVEKPVPFKPEGKPVFICVDLEWHELDNSIITEVGIAVLETEDTIGVPPAKNGLNWHNLIRGRHIRLAPYLHHVNHKFVQGCPGNFNFGKSEVRSQQETCEALEKLFASYASSNSNSNGEIVLVGHGLSGDIKSLRHLGIDIYGLPNMCETVDTKDLHSHLRKTDNGVSIKSLLSEFGLPYRYLHNAGNDAVYTMQALLAIILQKKLQSLDLLNGRNDDPGVLGQGWSSCDEDDGGRAPPLVRQPQTARRRMRQHNVKKPEEKSRNHKPESTSKEPPPEPSW